MVRDHAREHDHGTSPLPSPAPTIPRTENSPRPTSASGPAKASCTPATSPARETRTTGRSQCGRRTSSPPRPALTPPLTCGVQPLSLPLLCRCPAGVCRGQREVCPLLDFELLPSRLICVSGRTCAVLPNGAAGEREHRGPPCCCQRSVLTATWPSPLLSGEAAEKLRFRREPDSLTCGSSIAIMDFSGFFSSLSGQHQGGPRCC